MEHLTNCHGEWNTLFAIAGALPFVGAWAKYKLYSWKQHIEESEPCEPT
jgi:hypothetical protein